MKLDNMFWIVLLLGLHQIIDELEFSKIYNVFWQNLNVSELVYLEYFEALYIVSVLCLLDLGLGIYLKQLLNILASFNFFDNENPLMLHYIPQAFRELNLIQHVPRLTKPTKPFFEETLVKDDIFPVYDIIIIDSQLVQFDHDDYFLDFFSNDFFDGFFFFLNSLFNFNFLLMIQEAVFALVEVDDREFLLDIFLEWFQLARIFITKELSNSLGLLWHLRVNIQLAFF